MTPADAKLVADLDAAEARATKGPWRVDVPGTGARTDGQRGLRRSAVPGSCQASVRPCSLPR